MAEPNGPSTAKDFVLLPRPYEGRVAYPSPKFQGVGKKSKGWLIR